MDTVTYQRNASAEVNPFEPALEFEVGSAISDGEASVQNQIDFTADGSGVDMRFGRLIVEDSYGPETNSLILPLHTEYFLNGAYQPNTLDSCTTWDNANATVSAMSSVQAGSGTLGSGTSGSDGITLTAPTAVPGTPDTGDATVTYDAPSWLEGDFDNDGNFGDDPEATATFGVYRGHERVIYRKEVR